MPAQPSRRRVKIWARAIEPDCYEGSILNSLIICLDNGVHFMGCEVVELNVQVDHVHLLVMVPPKLAISQLVGTIKGKSAIQIFKQFPYLKKKPYWGNHFWAKGYCVDTVGVDAEMIRKYVKYQEKIERGLEC